MNKLKQIFKKLTAYDHFLVFLIILTAMKIANVFIVNGTTESIHFAKLGVGLLVITSVLHLVFTKVFDKNKKYLHSLISAFLIIVMLSHADPEPIRGVLVILLLFVAKFFVKYKGKNIFNPVVFTIAMVTFISYFVPFFGVPPLDFTGIDIRFPINGMQVPLTLLPISLALIFNVKRLKKHPLAISFIIASLLLGFFLNAYESNPFSYIIITMFIGSAVIVEPKTSPHKPFGQVIYGLLMAVFIFLFSFLNIPNSIIIALFLANIAYFVLKEKTIIRRGVS